MTDSQTQDPAAIEREIRETQNNMSSTIDKIGDQLSIKNMFNAMLDKADQNNIDARMVLDGARRNPVALGLIAIGAIWLISEKDAKIPSLNLRSGKQKSNTFSTGDTSYNDNDHNDYLTHMAAIERRTDEDDMAYQRRRDDARSNFFMVERNHEEDEGAFRKRLDGLSETFRQKRHDFANRSGKARDAAMEKASMAAGKTKDVFTDNPFVGGIVAAAVGAAVGASLPVTRQEQSKLGPIGGKLRQSVGTKTEEATAKLREKKDELLEKADAALKPGEPAANSNPVSTGEFSSGREGQLA